MTSRLIEYNSNLPSIVNGDFLNYTFQFISLSNVKGFNNSFGKSYVITLVLTACLDSCPSLNLDPRQRNHHVICCGMRYKNACWSSISNSIEIFIKVEIEFYIEARWNNMGVWHIWDLTRKLGGDEFELLIEEFARTEARVRYEVLCQVLSLLSEAEKKGLRLSEVKEIVADWLSSAEDDYCALVLKDPQYEYVRGIVDRYRRKEVQMEAAR